MDKTITTTPFNINFFVRNGELANNLFHLSLAHYVSVSPDETQYSSSAEYQNLQQCVYVKYKRRLLRFPPIYANDLFTGSSEIISEDKYLESITKPLSGMKVSNMFKNDYG